MKILLFMIPLLILLDNSTFAQNPAGMALNLDGDGDYMELSYYADSLIFGSPATIEFWLRMDVDHKFNTTDHTAAVWSAGDGNSHSEGEWFLLCYGHSTQFLNNEWISVIHHSDQGSTVYGLVDEGTYTDQWHHYALVCDGSQYILYTDGQNRALTAAPYFENNMPGAYGELITPEISVAVGRQILATSINLELDGAIDELRIWNTVRSGAKIKKTMFDTLAQVYYTSTDSGLVGYWRFDVLEDLGVNEDGVDDIRDLSINGYHGDLSGDALIDTSRALVSVEVKNNVTIWQFNLHQNYPNPFNPTTTIKFDLPKTSEVTLRIFNILGEEVATLVSDRLKAGSYAYEWNASNQASGVYLYRLSVGFLTRKSGHSVVGEAGNPSRAGQGFVETKKMVLTR